MGEREHGYSGGSNAAGRPDRFSAGDDGEALLYDQTGQDDYVRGVFYFGGHRTYAQGVSFVNFNNARNFDRAEFLSDLIDELIGYGGHFSGRVVSNMTDEPLEEARVELPQFSRSRITDIEGNFSFGHIPVETFTAAVTRRGYTPVDEVELTFDGERELNNEFRMLHSEMTVEPERISAAIYEGQSEEDRIEVVNQGDGPLQFSTILRGIRAEGGFWSQLEEINATAVTQDRCLQAAVFLQDYFWVAGGHRANDPNYLYKLSREGEYVSVWLQESDSDLGWRDLTTDGEYLYGVDDRYIAQISPETGEVTGVRIPSPLDPTYAVAWDDEHEQFWVSCFTTDIIAIDRNGTRCDTIENNQRFIISGLFYFADDPDGYPLYILNNLYNEEGDPVVRIIKCDVETGDVTRVADLPVADGERSGGCSITNAMHPFTWTAVVQMQADQDWLRMFEVSSDFFWCDIDPSQGELNADEELVMDVTIDATGLGPEQTYNAYLQFVHNTTAPGPLWVDISLTVLPLAVSARKELPLQFKLEGVYPNPFNSAATVHFELPTGSHTRLSLFDITGREVGVLLDDLVPAGRHHRAITPGALPGGVYLIRLTAGDFTEVRKVVYLP